MSEILDEHLTKERRKENLCRHLRFYTLLFSGIMASLHLVFNQLNWRGGRIFIIIGLVSISLQSLTCFLSMKKKTWIAAMRAVISIIATIYILYALEGY